MNITPLAPILVLIIACATTACSPGKTTLQGNETLACSPEVHFISHTVICQKERQGNWVACQLNGSVENAGAARATNVIVKIRYPG